MQEIVSLGQNKKALKFPYMILGGLIISIILGSFLDQIFNTTPIIILVLMTYTIVGSFILLIRDKQK